MRFQRFVVGDFLTSGDGDRLTRDADLEVDRPSELGVTEPDTTSSPRCEPERDRGERDLFLPRWLPGVGDLD